MSLGSISAFASQCCFVVFISAVAAASGQHLTGSVEHSASLPGVATHYTRDAAQSLSRRGVSFHSTFVHDLSKSPFRAHGDSSWFARYSADLSMDVDAQKAMQWNGTSFHLDIKKHASVAGYGYLDVEQGYSNIDAESRIYLYEAWVLQNIGQDRMQIQLGQIDANTRFASVATAADFLNSSMGYSPTIMSFPTYPHPKPGIEVSVNLPASYRIEGGGFETGGAKMALVEADKKWTLIEGATGNVEVGYWKLTQQIMRDGERVPGTHGYYAVLEQSLWNGETGRDGSSARKLTGFLQLGFGDALENSFSSHVGSGLVLQSPFSRRRADSIGVAATRVCANSDTDDRIPAHAEFVAEEYYKLVLKRGIAVVADAQYFVNPGAGAHSMGFFVVTPRLVYSF